MRVRSGCVYSTLSDSDKRRPPAIDSQREPATGGHLCPAAWGEIGYRGEGLGMYRVRTARCALGLRRFRTEPRTTQTKDPIERLYGFI